MNDSDRFWNEYAEIHLTPARCIQLGVDLEEMTNEETNHLAVCDKCRTNYEFYYQNRHLVQ